MEQMNDEIKQEFEFKINEMQENDKKRSFFINTLCYTVSIFLFVAVLIGTTISIKNFIDAKQEQENASRGPVIELKKID